MAPEFTSQLWEAELASPLPLAMFFHPHSTSGAPPVPFSALVIILSIEERLHLEIADLSHGPPAGPASPLEQSRWSKGPGKRRFSPSGTDLHADSSTKTHIFLP